MNRKDSIFESTSYYHQRFPGNCQLEFERCHNFTSDQFTGFHAIVIPGTLRDSGIRLRRDT